MESKLNANTVILVLILLALVGGGLLFFGALRQLTQPLEAAEQALQERFEGIVNPTPTIIPDPVTIILQVRDLSRLETASYTVEKVITAESGQGAFAFLFGDRLILVAHGQVIAGVDLGKMGEDDIILAEEGTVVVTLPAAEILVVDLDNQDSYIYDRDTGVIANGRCCTAVVVGRHGRHRRGRRSRRQTRTCPRCLFPQVQVRRR